MASSNPKADRLAKSLQLCLSNSLGGLSRLRALGWFELLQGDWPSRWSARCGPPLADRPLRSRSNPAVCSPLANLI